MERLQEDAGQVASHHHRSDRTKAGLIVIVALSLYVLGGASVTFPSA